MDPSTGMAGSRLVLPSVPILILVAIVKGKCAETANKLKRQCHENCTRVRLALKDLGKGVETTGRFSGLN